MPGRHDTSAHAPPFAMKRFSMAERLLRHRKGVGSGDEVTHFNNRTQITDEPYRSADLLA